jgi:hypothetical protein
LATEDAGSELPAEELAVEFLGLRKVGRGDVESGNAPRPDIRRWSLGGLGLELTCHQRKAHSEPPSHFAWLFSLARF